MTASFKSGHRLYQQPVPHVGLSGASLESELYVLSTCFYSHHQDGYLDTELSEHLNYSINIAASNWE